ncbi:MAG: hypothetical protein U1E53_02675 [Dongiaceae bacterium]
MSPTSAPADEVMQSRIVESPTSVYIDPELASLSRKVEVSTHACGAWSFPMNVGPALVETLRRTNEVALKHQVPGGTATQPAEGAAYHIVITLEDFEARVVANPQFFTGLLDANAELSLRVRVLDAKGVEVLKALPSGEGSAEVSGDCSDGAPSLSKATGKAMKRTAESYVDKVINSGVIH